MKVINTFNCAISLFALQSAFAAVPVTISSPTPAIASSFSAGSNNVFTYTITNNVPKSFPISISGISAPITRLTSLPAGLIDNDCGDALKAGPSTCTISLLIAPTASNEGHSVNQTLAVDYQGRTPLTSNIMFSVPVTMQYGYVADDIGNVYQCSLNASGGFNTCTPTPSSGAPSWEPLALAFATIEGTQYGYVADLNQHVYQCTLNSNGSFNSCARTPASGAPTWLPEGIAFATVDGTQYGYVSDNPGHHVYRCTLNTDGSFHTCTATPSSGAPSWHPAGIAFSTVDGTQYGYVADNNTTGHVYQCTLNTDGSFNTCASTGGSTFASGAHGVAFATLNGTQYGYVTTATDAYQCTLNSNGTFNVCSINNGGATFTTAFGIGFSTTNGTQYGYVTDPATSSVFQCTLNTNGSFNVCTPTPSSGAPVWAPFGVAFASS